jgi:hypothetical protein
VKKIDDFTNIDKHILPLNVTPFPDGISTMESHIIGQRGSLRASANWKAVPVRASLLIRTGLENDSGKERC